MKGSLLIAGCFLIGILVADTVGVPAFLLNSDIDRFTLYALMFFVGVGTGANTDSWEIIRKMKWKIFLVPASIICGSLLGAAAVSLLMDDLAFYDALAVGAGLGYFSVSSILIKELRGETLAAIAFLANLIRQLVTLFLTPLFHRFFGKLAPIATGGATAMDSTLPVITKSVGTEYALVSLFSGVILTFLVPVMIALILRQP